MTHASDICPFVNQDPLNPGATPATSSTSSSCRPQQTLSESDPLFGVLKDDQVGIHPISGRLRIAPEVLQEMRNYLMASTGEDRSIKEQRIISSVSEVEKDHIAQKTVLQLIPPPTITSDLNRGKGFLFDNDPQPQLPVPISSEDQSAKLMSAAISAGRSTLPLPQDHGMTISFSPLVSTHIISSTVSQLNFSLTESIAASNVKGKARRRPGKYARNAQAKDKTKARVSKPVAVDSMNMLPSKRKAEEEVADAPKPSKLKASRMVPKEGPSTA